MKRKSKSEEEQERVNTCNLRMQVRRLAELGAAMLGSARRLEGGQLAGGMGFAGSRMLQMQ